MRHVRKRPNIFKMNKIHFEDKLYQTLWYILALITIARTIGFWLFFVILTTLCKISKIWVSIDSRGLMGIARSGGMANYVPKYCRQVCEVCISCRSWKWYWCEVVERQKILIYDAPFYIRKWFVRKLVCFGSAKIKFTPVHAYHGQINAEPLFLNDNVIFATYNFILWANSTIF